MEKQFKVERTAACIALCASVHWGFVNAIAKACVQQGIRGPCAWQRGGREHCTVQVWMIVNRCVMRWSCTGIQGIPHPHPSSLPRVCKPPLTPHAYEQCGSDRMKSLHTYTQSPFTHPTKCEPVQPSPFKQALPHQHKQPHTHVLPTHIQTTTPTHNACTDAQ